MDSITINITETPTEVTVNVFDATAALRGGTTGQVLTKASDTDLDFEWGAGGGGGGGTVDSVSGTTDRIIITGTAADPIVNIASGYDVAITAEIAAAIAGLNDTITILHGSSSSITPADSTYYYFGFQNSVAGSGANNTTTSVREIGCPATGTIVSCVISAYVLNGSTVSTEQNTLVLRNTTQSTLETITTTWTYRTSLTANLKSQVVTGLNIAVTEGDMLQSVIGAPAFATNPTSSWLNFYYIIQL